MDKYITMGKIVVIRRKVFNNYQNKMGDIIGRREIIFILDMKY